MARTFIRQETQIRNSTTYDDTIAPSLANFETNPTNALEDLNNIRSGLKTLMGVTNWYDTTTRDVETIVTDLADIETKKILCRANILTDVTVGGSDNWVILSVAGSEAPSEVKAIATSVKGAVAAQTATSGAGFAVNELDEIAGPDALHPKNLLLIRDSTSGQAIQSGGMDVFGLLQTESTATDGTVFDDVSAGDRAKISFVRANAGFTDLEAVPAGDIQGKTINYNYVKRDDLDGLPEDCNLASLGFIDSVGTLSIDRQTAYDNQGATAVNVTTNSTLDLEGAGLFWEVRDDLEATVLRITEGSAGGTTVVQVAAATDTFDVDAAANDFAQGVTVDSAGTAINVGVTAGQIDAAAALTLTSTGANDTTIGSGQELFLDDANQTGSTWAQTGGIKLSETTAEWDTFETNFGETSILDAINQAFGSGARGTKIYANVTTNVNEDVDVGGVGGGANLDAQLPDMSGGTFVDDYDIYVNGGIQRNGANAAANNDVYPGTSLANGQLKFEYKLKTDDVVLVVPYA